MKKMLIALGVLVCGLLVLLFGRIHARLWQLESVQSFDHASIIIYLHPDEQVVKCYQEFLWREQAK